MNQLENIQKYLFRVIILLLFIPMIQARYGLFEVGPLGGYEPIPNDVEVTGSTWFEGSFQRDREAFLKTHFGFRNWALRLDHQIAYSLYNQSKVHAVVLGQNGYLFDYDYILEHNGKFEPKPDEIKLKLDRLRLVQDTLQKLGKHLVVVIGPNKADFFPEYLPKEDQIPRESLKTNYDWYIEGMKSRNINHIDANNWFLQMKGKMPYPLFPQTGIHFSFYGAALFNDTIIKNIEIGLGKDLPDMTYNQVEWDTEPREEDDDLEDALNILYDLPGYKLPYPTVLFDEHEKYKPRAITIGDSFYWRFVNWGGLEKVYNNGQFWYYNKDAHPGPRQVEHLNFEEEIANTEVICILMASVNLWRFGFGFDDQLYKHFFIDQSEEDTLLSDPQFKALLDAKMEEARNNQEWFAYIEKKARETGRPTEEVLKEDAIFVVKKDLNMD